MEKAPNTHVVRATQQVQVSQPLSSAIPGLRPLCMNRVAVVAKMEVTYEFINVGSLLSL